MTLLLVPDEAGTAQRLVEFDNQALGVEAVHERVGTWQEAMADPAFVRDMDSFLDAAAESDAEIFDLPADGALNR
jgi:hypothetical protein